MMNKKLKKVTINILSLMLVGCVAFTNPIHARAELKQGSYNNGIGVLEDEIDAGRMTAEEVLGYIRKGYLNSEISIACIVAEGYLLQYKDTIVNEGYVSQATMDRFLVAYGITETGQINDKKEDSNVQANEQQTSTEKKEEKKEPVITEESASGDYVITDVVDAYEDVAQTEKKSKLNAATEVELIGKLSDGTLHIRQGKEDSYIKNENIVIKDEWDKAWKEIERVDLTCTTAGKVTYANGFNKSITREESLEATGHSYQEAERKDATCTEEGFVTYKCENCDDSYKETLHIRNHEVSEEWTVTKEATLFAPGMKEKACKVCGEPIEKEEIVQKAPVNLTSVIATILIIVAIVVGIYFKFRTRTVITKKTK